ncbi:VF530 family protein [Kangiella spongicola]|uniref:DUF2132 domain-containing protein n=1 Tax=Kangiella spongicola TaxID=796379 RepID=A0A318D1Y9_9GAMM|nr:VF530 family DNA-binding protein [Kangiella spongicola]PXF63170.1 hypothetical protein DL796_06905 [Kangiella spongicola]
MSEEINYKNNPLNGVGLKALVTELVDHYGFEILHAYLNLNCFKTNPSVESSVKFLKKTDWAREKVEAFYMYQYKSLPPVSSEQFHIPPRDRIVSDDEKPGEPAKLSLEDAEKLQEKRAAKAEEYSKSGGRKFSDKSGHNKRAGASRGRDYNKNYGSKSGSRSGGRGKSHSSSTSSDPWGQWKDKSED